MAVDRVYTNRDICTQALRKIGVVAKDTPPDADDIEVARENLFRLLKTWGARGYSTQALATMSVPVVAGITQTLTPERPLAIKSARLKRGNIETPMFALTRIEYDELPNKVSQGVPVNFHYNRQKETGQFWVWPVLASVNGETIEITYVREFEDVELNDPCDVSAEWYDAIVYNLADSLLDDYEIDKPKITMKAREKMIEALDDDAEASVFFNAAS